MQPVNTFPYIFSVFGHTFVNNAQRQHNFLVTFDTQKMHAFSVSFFFSAIAFWWLLCYNMFSSRTDTRKDI